MKQLFLSLTVASVLLNFSCKKNESSQEEMRSPAQSGLFSFTSETPTETDGSARSTPGGIAMNLSRGGGGSAFDDPNACTTCLLKYPDSSNLPRSSAAFNESDCLVASAPGVSTCSVGIHQIKVWYSDEHAMTLGVRRVIIKKSSGTTTIDYPYTAQTSSASDVDNPLVGTIINTGDQSGNDVAVGGGRPLRPSLYVTDITNDPTNRSGDWQQGGIGFAPNHIHGTWKNLVKTVDYTKNPALVSITADSDPQQNHWNLAGGDAPPAGTIDDGFGCEVVWDIAALNLIPNHKYRCLFMVHDGDQNKVGGDVGEACITIIARSNGILEVHAPD